MISEAASFAYSCDSPLGSSLPHVYFILVYLVSQHYILIHSMLGRSRSLAVS